MVATPQFTRFVNSLRKPHCLRTDSIYNLTCARCVQMAAAAAAPAAVGGGAEGKNRLNRRDMPERLLSAAVNSTGITAPAAEKKKKAVRPIYRRRRQPNAAAAATSMRSRSRSGSRDRLADNKASPDAATGISLRCGACNQKMYSQLCGCFKCLNDLCNPEGGCHIAACCHRHDQTTECRKALGCGHLHILDDSDVDL